MASERPTKVHRRASPRDRERRKEEKKPPPHDVVFLLLTLFPLSFFLSLL